ncbi:hypothetical protein FG379_001025 [Cryptosporidium bovis]|uniref:uncharacterized protein n=1 Tax=Cryptosporidium bovis TaxID=310047 RepID=UPI00351A44B6|nr:hypothetical protein FG379_001025 [Cryptosporidium bovis]
MKRKEKNKKSKLCVKQDKVRILNTINEEIKTSRDYFNLILDNFFLDSLYERLFLISKDLEIKVVRRSELGDKHIKQMLDITRYNMKELYDQNPWGDIWKNGWSDDLKFQELSNEMCNYIIIYRKKDEIQDYSSGEHHNVNLSGNFGSEIEIASFLCFRIELEGDIQGKIYLVGYMYELQSLYKGNGCGKLLVDIFGKICEKMRLEKIMCTVLKENMGARRFYSNKCEFTVDEISPTDEPYIILSKNIGIPNE